MEFKTYMDNLFNEDATQNAEKDIAVKPDENPKVTKPNPTPAKSRAHKWTKVNSWEEVLEKREEVLKT